MGRPQRDASIQPPQRISDLPRLAPRDPQTHKGEVGRVVIVAGSRGMSGAAALAGLGALRGGAGLVRILTPASIQPVIAAGELCAMSVAMPETDSATLSRAGLPLLDESLAWCDVVAIGPGMGLAHRDDNMVLLARVLDRACPTVIDADALNSADDALLRTRPNAVLTPHPGEMSRLRKVLGLDPRVGRDDDARVSCAHELAVFTGGTVVLKGHRTVVADPQRAFVNETGNPGMATGGMGDVLTGLIATLMGQKLPPFDAACLAVHVHGSAADRCAERIGPVGYLARDVADAIPAALNEALRPRLGFRP